jgi:hypothetical protein
VIAADVDSRERADGVDDFVGIGAVTDDVAEVPKFVEGAGEGEYSLEGLEIAVNVRDDEGTHGRRVRILRRGG